jgi:nitrite reductase/ring-hydroxylating ferredoxin subunit
MIVGTEVTCPWHGAVFDVTTGSVLGAPAPQDVAHYAVWIDGDDIELEL